MGQKKIFTTVYVKDEVAYSDKELHKAVDKDLDVISVCVKSFENGTDGIIYVDLSYDDASHEKAINNLRVICKETDIPVYATGNIKRVEDVKKYLYAGSKAVLLDMTVESNVVMMTEATNRFGADKVGVILPEDTDDSELFTLINENKTEIVVIKGKSPVKEIKVPAIHIADDFSDELLGNKDIAGVSAPEFATVQFDYMKLKRSLKEKGLDVNTFESAVPFSEFKLNEDGLIPVVVQDYATDEVLMLAYMNEESYRLTLETGRMTYYSRSRQEIWLKGLTSGHYQYVISLSLDCDNDTILAKVRQVGAACHTGAHSCFFKNLVSKNMTKTNPLNVLKDVMAVIKDRQVNPKEGSYTNYLFDKGIDKILKKVGEEATEIVIAAKNPDPVEVKYEIADFLYHVMVLMAERGLDWDEVMEELANR